MSAATDKRPNHVFRMWGVRKLSMLVLRFQEISAIFPQIEPSFRFWSFFSSLKNWTHKVALALVLILSKCNAMSSLKPTYSEKPAISNFDNVCNLDYLGGL